MYGKIIVSKRVLMAIIMTAMALVQIQVISSITTNIKPALADLKPFVIVSIEWSDDPIPGAQDLTLTVRILNNSTNTIKGCCGILYLSHPFLDHNNPTNKIIMASAVPSENSPVNTTEEIKPMATFTFQYNLDIALNATKGTYELTLQIAYSIYSAGVYKVQPPENLTLRLRIANRPPEIESYNPSDTTINVEVGNQVNFSVVCSDPDNDPLYYKWLFDGKEVSNTTYYTYVPKEDHIGSHTLEFHVNDSEDETVMTWTVVVTKSPTTTITPSTSYLRGGFENTIKVNISNTMWNGKVSVTINVQNPLILRSNQTIIYNNVDPNSTITATVVVFAPETALGNTLTITITVEYMDLYGNSYRESFNLNFMIKGSVEIIVYDVNIAPDIAKPGDIIQISGTLLNKGTITAKFVNVSILPSEVFLKTKDWMSFIGEVDVNSPAPFTVCALVNSPVKTGTYVLTIKIEFYDDLYNKFEIYYNVSVTVQEVEQLSTPVKHPIQQFVEQGGLMASAVGVIAVTLVLIYLRRRMVGGGA